MSGFTYENQGAETMLVYHLNREEHLDEFSKGMLQENEIAGVLKPSFTQKDTERYIKYPVTSRIPLKDFMAGEMDRKTVIKIFLSITGAMKETGEYMLDYEKILMDPAFIFMDIRKKETSLVYLPVDEFSEGVLIKEFFLGMLSHMRFSMDEDVSYVAKLIHFLNQPGPWELDALKRYLETLINEENAQRSVLGNPGEYRKSEEHRKSGEYRNSGEYRKSGEYRGFGEYGAEGDGGLPAGGFRAVSQPAFGEGKTNAGNAKEKQADGSPEQYPVLAGTEADPEKGWGELSGKKESREKAGKKRGGLFRGKNAKAELEEKDALNAPGIRGGMKIPGTPGVQGGMEVPGVPGPRGGMEIPGAPGPRGGMEIPGAKGMPGSAEGESRKERPKKGFFGFGKRKDTKPPIVPMASVTPVTPMVSVTPTASAAPVDSGGNAPERLVLGMPVPRPVPEYRQESRTDFSVPGNENIYIGHGNSEDEERTVILGGEEENACTVLLGQGSSDGEWNSHVIRLIRRRTGQSVVINQQIFRIGSAGGYVDFYIADNPAIGGWHADITEADGNWYIMDRNSANHTYVNGVMAQPMQAVRLRNGEVITLADEDFEFIIS